MSYRVDCIITPFQILVQISIITPIRILVQITTYSKMNISFTCTNTS